MGHLLLQPGARILFQGDSITDAGRSRDNDALLGAGYANLIAAWLSARYPGRELTFLNRGVSGNRVYDLEERWTRDCIDLHPDWVSILIGINDTWRRYDSGKLSPIEEFEACYRRLLDRVKAETSARVILLEPFVLPTPPDRVAWREDPTRASPRFAASPRITGRSTCRWMASLPRRLRRPAAFWAADGVHPTQAGHALIAQAWIRAVEEG